MTPDLAPARRLMLKAGPVPVADSPTPGAALVRTADQPVPRLPAAAGQDAEKMLRVPMAEIRAARAVAVTAPA